MENKAQKTKVTIKCRMIRSHVLELVSKMSEDELRQLLTCIQPISHKVKCLSCKGEGYIPYDDHGALCSVQCNDCNGAGRVSKKVRLGKNIVALSKLKSLFR
jgi:hypothetical protein